MTYLLHLALPRRREVLAVQAVLQFPPDLIVPCHPVDLFDLENLRTLAHQNCL